LARAPERRPVPIVARPAADRDLHRADAGCAVHDRATDARRAAARVPRRGVVDTKCQWEYDRELWGGRVVDELGRDGRARVCRIVGCANADLVYPLGREARERVAPRRRAGCGKPALGDGTKARAGPVLAGAAALNGDLHAFDSG